MWKRFSPLETRLMAEVRRVLPPAVHACFDAQVASINRVQRSPPSWSEICYYRMRRGRVNWAGVPLFPCTDELRFAEVRFRAGGRPFKSTLTSIEGHIFDVATTPGPKTVAFNEWEQEPTAKLLGDPLRAPTGMKEAQHLPPSWETFLRRRTSEPRGTWELHDGATAYSVALDDGEYLVLAERGGDEFILHRVEPPSDGLFHLPNHDGTPEPLAGDIEEVIRGLG
jgi:hypothetical protein